MYKTNTTPSCNGNRCRINTTSNSGNSFLQFLDIPVSLRNTNEYGATPTKWLANPTKWPKYRNIRNS